jgi:hypothetical protein
MRKFWTPEENDYLVKNYPDMLTDDIGKILGRARSSIYGQALKLGLQKSESFKLSDFSGRLTGNQGKPFRFEKGHIPANKGKRMSSEQYEKARPTMFRKGQNPKNTKYDGCVTVRDGYFWIRISERNWKELHRVIWEQRYGPAPEGFKITFKDGNKMNCEINNLEIISNEDNMLRNSIHNYPEQLRDTIMTLGALKRKIRQYEEQH